jgi:transcriptional regulator with XRE-family HTH domain
MARPKPAISAWIQSERKRLGWKVADLSQKLLDLGYDAQPSTVAVWEASRTPRPETLDGLERLFGTRAPRDEPTDLAAAIRAQTEAMRELVEELREAREGRQGRDEGLAVVLAKLGETLERFRPEHSGTSR